MPHAFRTPNTRHDQTSNAAGQAHNVVRTKMGKKSASQNVGTDQLMKRALVLPIAKRIAAGTLVANEVQTVEEYTVLIESLGKSADDPFEMYMDRTAEQIEMVKLCLKNKAPESAAVLLFTLIEAEINQAIRFVMGVRGYDHNAISEALKDMNVKTKLSIILPLLDVTVEDRLKFTLLELTSLRNSIIHCKSLPMMDYDAGSKGDDYSINKSKAEKLFERTNLSTIANDLDNLHLAAVKACPSIEEAIGLVERF